MSYQEADSGGNHNPHQTNLDDSRFSSVCGGTSSVSESSDNESSQKTVNMMIYPVILKVAKNSVYVLLNLFTQIQYQVLITVLIMQLMWDCCQSWTDIVCLTLV